MSSASLAVVTVTYNSAGHLPGFLRDLHLPPGAGLWVVDNASGDGTLDHLAACPALQLIANQENLGFPAACNQGIAAALAQGAEFITLVNPDVRGTPGWLEEMVASAGTDETIGLVQATLLQADCPTLYNTRGNRMHYLGFGFCGEHLRPIRAGEGDREIPCASGAAVLIRRQVFARIGLLNPHFFLYAEDQEFSLRARLAGFRVLVSARACALHHYQFFKGPLKFYYLERNRWLLLLLHYQRRTLLLLLPALAVVELGMLGYACLTGWGGWKLKGWGDLWRNRRQIGLERQKHQQQRRLSDRDIKLWWDPVLDMPPIMNPVVKYILNPFLKGYWWIVQRWI